MNPLRKLAAAAAVAVLALSPAVAQEAKKKDTQASRTDTQSAGRDAKKGSLAGGDMKYLRQIAEANLAEVRAGKLGASKASSGEVKKFAQHMVDDHSKMLSEIRSMAKAKNAQLPSQPSKKHQDAMKKLQSASGDGFDKAFMTQMVKDHEEALKLVQDASKNAKDKELKAAAEKATPEIEKHLEMAKGVAASLK
jgi:putative membrane protein